MIGGKMFVAVCLDDDNQPCYITLKVNPAQSVVLRKKYDDIIEGYYMNKLHWISVKPDGKVPDELMRELVDDAYNLVLATFSKKKQIELLGE